MQEECPERHVQTAEHPVPRRRGISKYLQVEPFRQPLSVLEVLGCRHNQKNRRQDETMKKNENGQKTEEQPNVKDGIFGGLTLLMVLVFILAVGANM